MYAPDCTAVLWFFVGVSLTWLSCFVGMSHFMLLHPQLNKSITEEDEEKMKVGGSCITACKGKCN